VLSMERVARIQELSVNDGKTYREIALELGVSSKTIAKALNKPAKFAEGYQRRVPVPRRALGGFEDKIAELLRGKPWARGPGKRVRRTARWVFRQLRKLGYTGAESTVRTYIRQMIKQPRPACPIEHPPGDEAQFDFGEYPVLMAGKVTTVHFAGATFPYSTRRFLFAYPKERQECLLDGMEKTYRLAGGVTERATLDNTTLAVSKVLEGRAREETRNYLRFRTTLGLVPRFTNRGAGWEKGHVEGTVGWAKRQILQDLEVRSWEELNELLARECDQDAQQRSHGEEGKLVCELFEEERALLRPIPYEGCRAYKTVRAKVSPGGLIYVDGSRYSVPIRLRGRSVRVRLFADELIVTSEHTVIARYRRDWSGFGEHYRVEHYLELLEKAPALLDHGKPFVRMPAWLVEVRSSLRCDKELVELLLAVDRDQYRYDELKRACMESLEQGWVSRAGIQQRILGSRCDTSPNVTELEPKEWGGLGHHRFTTASAAVYDEILEEAI